ncbi:hypothetical protein CDL12_24121 [Handroanthus impetiginosus]|uniref:Protein root UVB sensitive/RUS domain-containing protein n=1 Tax=Handroanthus impetiginosus TaxID=429701 RepID=A0A2G9GDK0_9LAMI|nr:hypothetical protein CDL12_24121 [Handroanthus impetiginosus]
MATALGFSYHGFRVESRRNSIPARVDREESEAHLVLPEKYGNGTSKRYVVESDSQIRAFLDKYFPENNVFQDSHTAETGWELSWLPKVIKDFVLPAGFPDSVSDDYLEYILLQFPTNVTGWICHTLVTSSLLKAVGVGSFSGTTAAASAAAISTALLSGGALELKRNPFSIGLKWRCNFLRAEKKLKPTKVEARMMNPSTFSSRISADVALYEIPGASFDQYLEDKLRVFGAMFPDKRRNQQLNEEEWRVHLLPVEFLFLTVLPVIDLRLRCKSSGMGYPPEVPRDISKVLEIDIFRGELQGLDDVLKPSHFSLIVKGALYPDRCGLRSRLKGQLQMSMSFVLPPVLALVPEDICRDVAESVLKRLVENMKNKVIGSLIADYSEFKRERPKALA